MDRLRRALRSFFFPPPGSRVWVRVLPYAVLGLLTMVVLVAGVYAWDYTNSPQFCGTACHTMPPEYTSYLTSPHARIDCVECHIGRGFIATRVTRKAGDVRHIISLAFQRYEFPIRADDLRPARETCERCHFPEKFSDDSLREVRHYAEDRSNTPSSTYLILKTGGGTKRLGLGRGIHWHIENQVFYLPEDPEEQTIPFVRVVDDEGNATDYLDVESSLDPQTVDPASLKLMDCITCHNRITHLVYPPADSVERLMGIGLISPMIPEIRLKAVEVLAAEYPTDEAALEGIAGLEDYYRESYPDFYGEQADLIRTAVGVLQDTYRQSVFREQKSDWDSHPNNIGHDDSPGCFRCHDGKHLNQQGEAVRLECNLCHSIPVVVQAGDLVADIEISRGPEPQTHLNPNWISLHRQVFDPTCSSCHTTSNPGGTDNSSFCSNSACHGSVWTYAGFDAPALREILLSQLPPTPTPAAVATVSGPPTYASSIGALLTARCGNCHGESGIQGLDLTTYAGVMAGGSSGPAIIPGDPEASLLVQKQAAAQPHFGQLTPDELDLVRQWIEAGAPE
ncbi:MAG TPA: NapC/NirT family cytochrome c [Anaerolineales bacterium]|nr:NapC/NirT family cytochrome c [Anaerolineales bacterium]